jgi:hypothetical protein
LPIKDYCKEAVRIPARRIASQKSESRTDSSDDVSVRNNISVVALTPPMPRSVDGGLATSWFVPPLVIPLLLAFAVLSCVVYQLYP